MFAEQLFTSRQALWGTDYHYWAVMWPILTLAAIDGAARAGLLEGRSRTPGSMRRRLGLAFAVLPLLFSVVGICLPGGLFPFHNLVDGKSFGRSAHMLALQRAIDLVPSGVCVVTDDRLAVHLASSNRVSLPGRLGRAADYTVLDLTRGQTGFDTPSPQQALQEALREDDRQVFASQEVVVLRAADYRGPSPPCRP